MKGNQTMQMTPEAVTRTRQYQEAEQREKAAADAKMRAAKIKKGQYPGAPDGARGTVIEVYVCPTPDCTDAVVAGPQKLEEIGTGPKMEDKHQVTAEASRMGVRGLRHSRAECPTCRAAGRYVERVRCYALVV